MRRPVLPTELAAPFSGPWTSTLDETISAGPATATVRPGASSPESAIDTLLEGSLAPGEVVAGRYQIVRAIGRGGMGEVFEAVDRELGQTVAIKILRSEIADSVAARGRMLDELRLARRVSHPAVCRVFDIFRHTDTGGDGDLLGIAMEYLPGETLAARLRRPFGASEAERWVADVADALTAAHTCGVVHLDLKPGNVLLVERKGESRAILADFGVSRALAGGNSGPPPGGAPGTPEFLAPEIRQGALPAPTADVYSLGVLLDRVAGAAVLGTGHARTGWTQRRLRAWRRVAAVCRSDDPLRRPASPARVARDLFSERRRGLVVRLTLASTAAVSLAVVSYASWAPSLRGASFRSTIGVAETALAERNLALAQRGCKSAGRAAEGLDQSARLRAQGCLAEANGELQAAVRAYRALWALSPGDAELALALARLEGRLGRGRQALAVLDGVRRPTPSAAGVRLALAEAEAASVAAMPERKAEAASRARARLGDGGGSRSAWADLLLAEALVRLGRLDEAAPLLLGRDVAFSAAGDRPGSIRLELARADLQRARGERDAAAGLYETAARAAADAGYLDLQARALRGNAYNNRQRGRLEPAKASATRALEVLEPTRDEFQLAVTEGCLGRVVYDLGDVERARMLLEESIATLERLGADSAAHDMGFLAQIDSRQGRLGSARKRLARAAEVHRLHGDTVAEMNSLASRAWVELDAGDLAAAAATVAAAHALARSVPSTEPRTYLLAAEALVRYEQDALEEGRRLCEQARQRETRPSLLANLLSAEAAFAEARGDEAEHLRLATEALAAAKDSQWQEMIALAHSNLAHLWLKRGNQKAAEAAFAAATAQQFQETPATNLILGAMAAELRAARGDVVGALVDLEHLRRRSAEAGFELLQGEIELTLAELLHDSGRTRDAREVGDSLVERARRRGQLRLARLATELRDRQKLSL